MDAASADLEDERMEKVAEIKSAVGFKRVLCIFSTHSNENACLSFTKDGSASFEEVSLSLSIF